MTWSPHPLSQTRRSSHVGVSKTKLWKKSMVAEQFIVDALSVFLFDHWKLKLHLNAVPAEVRQQVYHQTLIALAQEMIAWQQERYSSFCLEDTSVFGLDNRFFSAVTRNPTLAALLPRVYASHFLHLYGNVSLDVSDLFVYDRELVLLSDDEKQVWTQSCNELFGNCFKNYDCVLSESSVVRLSGFFMLKDNSSAASVANRQLLTSALKQVYSKPSQLSTNVATWVRAGNDRTFDAWFEQANQAGCTLTTVTTVEQRRAFLSWHFGAYGEQARLQLLVQAGIALKRRDRRRMEKDPAKIFSRLVNLIACNDYAATEPTFQQFVLSK